MNQEWADKCIPWLVKLPSVRGLSVEPVLGSIPNLPLFGDQWLIARGKSAPDARRNKPAWIGEIRDQYVAGRARFLFRQWSRLSNNPDSNDPTAGQMEAAQRAKERSTVERGMRRAFDFYDVSRVAANPRYNTPEAPRDRFSF